MIVKKILSLPSAKESFWDFWKSENCTRDNTLFFDIETTGLAKEHCQVYLIGCLSYEKDSGTCLRQWFCEDPSQEPELLETFLDYAGDYSTYVHFNGSRFDIPFLEYRFRKYQLPTCFSGKNSLDLYLKARPLKELLKLPRLRQVSLESFLYPDKHRKNCSGKDCISLYKAYRKNPCSQDLELLLGHNQEDLEGLFSLSPLLSYCAFLEGDFQIQRVNTTDRELLLTLDLKYPLPVLFSHGGDGFYLTGQEKTLRLSITMKNGNLRQFYSDYKNYYYLPGEDTAIHKSLGSYLDPALRIPATVQNCYTWFPCTEQFLSSSEELQRYVRHNIFSRILHLS
ncbi:hypothetical protein B5F53_04865 [Blautia sp. An249]|uniref:ribonuclease H-like domain-containing protein n=1 Tax=Blautia sp. An249 TaxID=1965603 RepID=UPI000B3A2478|nr:ribonuclease H-like domain-containing protein [Blautia sp. An249]OUO80293.1 hypothetical protein B5F53_04865 [Blautia sp. An249]